MGRVQNAQMRGQNAQMRGQNPQMRGHSQQRGQNYPRRGQLGSNRGHMRDPNSQSPGQTRQNFPQNNFTISQQPPRLNPLQNEIRNYENQEQIDVNDSTALGKVISRELQKIMNGEDSDEEPFSGNPQPQIIPSQEGANSDMMAEIMKNIDFSKLMQPPVEEAKIEEIPDDEDSIDSEKMFREMIKNEGLGNNESLNDEKIREISNWVSKYSKDIAEKGKIERVAPAENLNSKSEKTSDEKPKSVLPEADISLELQSMMLRMVQK